MAIPSLTPLLIRDTSRYLRGYSKNLGEGQLLPLMKMTSQDV
jgi:hypothetical protein